MNNRSSSSTPTQSRKDQTERFGLGALIAIALCISISGLAIARLALASDWRIPACYLLALSLAGVVLNWRDKRRAEAGAWRTPESTLHLVEFLGGWPATFFVQRLLRHKTSKRSSQKIFWIIVLAHQVVAVDYLLDWPIATQVWDGGGF